MTYPPGGKWPAALSPCAVCIHLRLRAVQRPSAVDSNDEPAKIYAPDRRRLLRNARRESQDQ